MPSFVPLGPRARVATALFAGAATTAASIACVAACLTAPPSDIGTSTNERPLIVGTSDPPQGLLDGWPPDNLFLVPVFLPDPNAPCAWRVFDRDLESNATIEKAESTTCITSVQDGGVVMQDFRIAEPADGHCHLFTFVVAHGFSAAMIPDSIGGDIATWTYAPAGALCSYYDAGAFQDGAFPPGDAGFDGVPITPETGPGPESGADP